MAQLNNAVVQGNLRTTDFIKEGSKKLDDKFSGSSTTTGAISANPDNEYELQIKSYSGKILDSITLPQ